ncbi:protein wings apart-like [Armigeres subalbatus]|uniref:protein wings apart-like n=1 Tax=Armigeres subalbatus TaxID=124917 RepID=UPI002ED051AA
MSKWNKGHGLIVPIDSLLKEKENTNRPAPLRSAGLVGRWGITSFTSIRNTSYEFESTSPKESDDLNCPSNVASLSTQVPNPIKPKKFFKSRNTLPPVAIATPDPHRDSSGYGSPQPKSVLLHQAAQLQARIAHDAGGSPPYMPAGYYQPLGASSAVDTKVRNKKKSKKKKQKEPDANTVEEPSEPVEESAKKEKTEPKKEKKQKKVKKEVALPPELPKRNSSRIRNKVVNYNEDDDSFDMIPYRDEVSRTPPVSKLALEPAPVPEVSPTTESTQKPVEKEEVEEEEEEDEENGEKGQAVNLEELVQAPAPGENVPENSVVAMPDPPPVGLASPTKSGSGGSGTEDRVRTRERGKEIKTIPVPLASPSVLEHPPIVLRISKGTSRLVSTDSEDVHSPPHGTVVQPSAVAPPVISHQPTPPTSQESEPPAPIAEPAINLAPSASAAFITGLTPPEEEPKKDDLKIKITLSKGLISNGNTKHKKESKKELRHFKKRAIAREKGRSSKRAKRGDDFETQEEDDERKDEELLGGVAEDLRVDPIVLPNIRPQFPLPGTDAYELYRTLASPSGGDDFDSQSSILGSASSNNTPKHAGLAAADDCRIIHSRGSSDCGSDLELSQNSSTAAAPPSEINFESENTQDNKEEEVKEAAKPVEEKKDPPKEERVEVLKLSLKGTRSTRTTRSGMKSTAQIEVISRPEPVPVPAAISSPEPPVKKFGRATRNRNNNNNVVVPEVETVKEVEPVPEPAREPSPPLAPVQKTATRQYSRRKKNVVPPDYQQELLTSPKPPALEAIDSEPPPFTLSSESESALASIKSPRTTTLPTGLDLTTNSSRSELVTAVVQDENKPEPTEYKIKNKFKKSYFRSEEMAKQQQLQESRPLAETSGNNAIPSAAPASTLTVPPITIPIGSSNSSSHQLTTTPDQQQPVKLVISKKKGSIFKSRPLTGSAEAADKKRHVYKHKWDDDDDEGKDKGAMEETDAEKQATVFEGEPSGLSRVTKLRSSGGAGSDFDDEFDFDTKLKCDRDSKPYYTVVRNVKKAHQIQEIGEFQEMDDDVEYILSALQPDNPSATRCLSAMTLATKCMTPAFRMHVRAHGVVTRFFKALRDAHTDYSLGLCTATIMFVLSQDTLNMDLDRDSLELMLNLLDTDHRSVSDGDLSKGQLEKNQQKVRELCEEIKNSGKAKHMDLDNITMGSLAMESLLSLTSKRAGEWFKDELRNLGGLEHLIKTVSECCRQISNYVVEWTDDLLSKLQKIERCLRVLENVTILNEQNQSYILNYNNGSMITTLVKLLKLVDGEVVLNPTTERTPKEDRGVVLRDVIPPVLKIFITLTHPFNENAYGASVIGAQPHVITTSLHLLLRVGDYVPQKFIFEMNILVLLFLINLTMYTQANRHHLMTARAPDEFGGVSPECSRPTRGTKTATQQEMAVEALVDYFYRQDELARYAEKNTDAILDAKSKKNQDIEETVTKLLQKAGHHMEHTLMASYVGLLIGWIVMGSDENEATVRSYLKENNFVMMVASLEKYYNFLNLTANSDALSLQHVRQTKNIIDNLKRLDSGDRQQPQASTSSQSTTLATASSSSTTATAATPQRYGSRSSTRAHY